MLICLFYSYIYKHSVPSNICFLAVFSRFLARHIGETAKYATKVLLFSHIRKREVHFLQKKWKSQLFLLSFPLCTPTIVKKRNSYINNSAIKRNQSTFKGDTIGMGAFKVLNTDTVSNSIADQLL